MARPLSDHLRRTLVLGLPLVGSQLAHVLVGLTDTVMLGRYSVPALAAATLGTSFFFSLFVLGSGFAYAAMGLAAGALGQEDHVRVRRVVRMGLWLSLLTGGAMLPIFVWSGPILLALGQQESVAQDAQDYLRIAGLGLIPALLVATLRSHLSALERTRVVLWATLAGAALNVFMNWLLIFGNWGLPEMGVRGAAVASVSVHVLTAVVLAAYAARGPGMAAYEVFRNLHRPDWPIFSEIFRLGWPVGLTHLSESGLFAGSALMMGMLGAVPLAAHGIAIQIAAATFMVHMGLSQAATVRIGHAWGARDMGALRRAALAASLLSGLAAVVAIVLYLGGKDVLVGLFVAADDPKAPAILELGARLLVLAALFQLVDAGQVMALGFLRGIQDTKRPMVYAIVSYWLLGIPASYALGILGPFGPDGVWMGLVVGLAAATLALLGRFLRLIRARDGTAAPRPT